MGHFIHLLHTLQGTLNSLEGNFLVNDKGDFIIDHNENFIEIVSDVPPTPPPPPPPWGDPHVSVIGAIEADANYYFPTYNYYCYSLTQQIYTASEINFSGYITGIVFYPRGTCNDRTLAVYITPTVNSTFPSSDSIIISSSEQVISPTTVSITADEPMWLQFDNPYYYDGTNNILITVHDTTGTWDSSIMFDTFNTSSVYQAMYQYTDSSPGYSPYEINSMTRTSYKDSIQLLFNNAEPQGPMPPEDHYFMFTNRGNDTTVLFRTAATQSKVFINDEYAGKFAGGDTGASFSIPANAVIKVSGLKGFGNYNYNRGVIECTDSNANLSIDRFDESVAEYTDTDRVYMFSKNTGLKTITSWTGAENYTSLDRMFAYSDINTIITWEGLENVTSMYYAFANSELTTIPSTWAGLNNVTNMSTTFSSSKLTAIPATWEGLENVTTMYYAFNGVTTLTTIPNSWKGLENVTNMSQIFHGATNLASIPASWQYLSAVETMDYAFDNCTSLTTVPSTWTGLSHVTSMKYTFQNTGLTSIPASWAGLESVTNMLDTFCNTSITAIPSSWAGLENLAMMQYTFRNTPITALPSSWAPLSNVTQMTYTFAGCTSLTSIPSSWQGLSSLTGMSYTFHSCSSLTTIPATWNGLSSLTDMSYAFYNCTSLTAIPDSWDGLDNVTNMSYSFAHAGIITGGTTGFEHLSKLAKLPQAFRDCPNWTGSSLALCRYLRERNLAGYPSGWDFGYAFYNCTASDGYRYIPVDWGGLGEILYGTVEIGGKTYRTVQIYNQIWLADNLDYDFNGLTIDSTMGYPSYAVEHDVGPRACYLEDETTAKSKNHGLAYNWYAIKYLNDNKATLLPAGWHVPVVDEFEILVKYSSTSSTFGTNAGKNLKSKSEWSSAGVNYDGFDDLPAGWYTMNNPPRPYTVEESGSFWTLTESSNLSSSSYFLGIGANNNAALSNVQRKSVGFHVRLVKNLT